MAKLLLPLSNKPAESRTTVTGRRVVFCLLGLLAMGGFWYSVRLVFVELDLSELSGLWAPALAFVLFGVVVGFVGTAASLLHASNLGGLTILLGALAPLAIFPFSLAILGACLVAAVGWGRYWGMVSEETTGRIRYSLTRGVTHGLGTVVLMTVLAVALTSLGFIGSSETARDRFIDRLVNGASQAAVKTLEQNLSGFRPEMTVDEFLLTYGPNEVIGALPISEGDPGDLNASFVPDLTKEQLAALDAEAQRAAIATARAELLNSLGIRLTGTDPVEKALNALVEQKVRPVLEQYERYIPPVVALAVFSALTILGALYFWWAVGWAWAWYGLVKAFGWVGAREETMTAHRIVFNG